MMKQSMIWVCMLAMFLLAGCNLGVEADVTAIPTPDIPRAEILAPQNNQQAIEDVNVVFDIVARDESQGIALVELYIDEVLVNSSEPVDEEAVPIFRTEMNWRAQGIGIHFVEVIAYRADGQQGDPVALTIEVLPRE